MEDYRRSKAPKSSKLNLDSADSEMYNEFIAEMFQNVKGFAEQMMPIHEGNIPEDVKLRLENMTKSLIATQRMVEEVSASFAEIQPPNINDKDCESMVKLDRSMNAWALETKKQLKKKIEKSKEESSDIENHDSWITLQEIFERGSGIEEVEGGDNADQEGQASQLSQDNSQELPDPEDEDGTGGSNKEVIPQLDPISKVRLIDPIRNKICGHIYGKASMMGLVQNKKKVRCPAMGCTNRNYIRVQDLIEDKDLTRQVQKREAKLKSQSQRK